ncbi:MAG: malate dehydrogenase [Deltaproteobacteria bacterium]|nr:malate dehydrogenase [Candidatus Zymogenaceae bacterium]
MPQRKKIVIIGAGNVGSSCALFAAQRQLGDVTLIDIVSGMPEGKALDMAEGAPLGLFDARLSGGDDMGAVAGADVVIVTAGLARKPGMSRTDLAKTNTGIVKGAVEKISRHAPGAFVIVVTNPLDVMTWVTKEVTGFARERVVGMAGALDAARFSAFVADALGVSVKDVHAMVLGGHGDTMVPLVRCASVAGIPITELLSAEKIDELVNRTRLAGGEIVKLLGTGSAYISPAQSAVMMAEGFLLDQGRVTGASAYLEGEYGFSGICLGVPVKISGKGVERIIEIGLSKEERKMLEISAAAVKKEIDEIRGEIG